MITGVSTTSLAELDQLRRLSRDFFESVSPLAAVRPWLESPAGYEKRIWSRMANELGAQSIGISSDYGGQGFGVRELSVVAESAGRVLLRAPFLASSVFGTVMVSTMGGPVDWESLLRPMATGELVVSAALVEEDLSGEPDSVSTIVTSVGRGGSATVSGTKRMVAFGSSVDRILVPAQLPDEHGGGIAVIAVDVPQAGLSLRARQALDLTNEYADIVLNDAAGTVLGWGRDASERMDAYDRALSYSRLCLAADILGSSSKIFEMAVAYAKERVQFGQPIGSFQSIQHTCADMFVELEMLRGALSDARDRMDANTGELRTVAGLAKAAASDTGTMVALESLHVFGGIGFTWEHDAHLFVRRAKSSGAMLGDSAYHYGRHLRRRLAQDRDCG